MILKQALLDMNEKMTGFTLMEMLFTIVVISLLMFISVPVILKVIQTHQTGHFFTVLDSDIFYIQNQALGTRQNVRMVFDEEYYIISHTGKKVEIRRYYTKHLTCELDI